MRGQWKQWAATDSTVIQQSSEENIANGYKKTRDSDKKIRDS